MFLGRHYVKNDKNEALTNKNPTAGSAVHLAEYGNWLTTKPLRVWTFRTEESPTVRVVRFSTRNMNAFCWNARTGRTDRINELSTGKVNIVRNSSPHSDANFIRIEDRAWNQTRVVRLRNLSEVAWLWGTFYVQLHSMVRFFFADGSTPKGELHRELKQAYAFYRRVYALTIHHVKWSL